MNDVLEQVHEKVDKVVESNRQRFDGQKVSETKLSDRKIRGLDKTKIFIGRPDREKGETEKKKWNLQIEH